MGQLANKWIENYQENAQIRLFCFPYAGGSASIYQPWRHLFPPTINVCPIQLPGRGRRIGEPPLTSMKELVNILSDVLLPYTNIPFAFFGHSMGALLSFELARCLRGKKVAMPMYLFLSAYNAPQLLRKRQQPMLHTLNDLDFTEKLREYAGTPEELLINDELMSFFAPILRSDFSLCDTYSYIPEEPLPCPIIAFGGKEDNSVSEENLRAWKEQSSNDFSSYIFPGKHFFLQNSYHQIITIITNFMVNA